MNALVIHPLEGPSYDMVTSFGEEFAKRGHGVTSDPKEATCVFFDRHFGEAAYDPNLIIAAVDRKLPVVVFDNRDFWGSKHPFPESWGSQRMVHSSPPWSGNDNWRVLNEDRTMAGRFLQRAVEDKLLAIWFMRKMTRSESYPDFVRQLDLVWWKGCQLPAASKLELSSRFYDVCFIGSASNFRANFLCDLIYDGRLKCYAEFMHHSTRYSPDEWRRKHGFAKMFIEADGGGYGSERPYQLMRIAPMLKQGNDQLIHEDFINGSECIKVGSPFGRLTFYDIEHVVNTVNDPDRLHAMYLAGIAKMDAHFTVAARAERVIKTCAEFGIV